MDGVVVFVIAEFRALYPTIKATDAQLEMHFKFAVWLLGNDKCSLVKDLEMRKYFLYLLVAHMATLDQQADEGSPVVGRVSSATEGTVSIGLDYGEMNDNARWYLQTPYGAKYWQMIKRFRSMLYRLGKAPMPVRRTYIR